MWKRGEVVRPPVGGRDATSQPQPAPAPPAFARDQPGRMPEPAPQQPPPQVPQQAPQTGAKGHMDKDVINIGKSVVIKGELNGSEDLTVEGTVEGKIELRDHVLTIGAHGKIKAEVFAKVAIILGEVTGNITATEKVDIRENGSVDGNIVSPRVAIAEGSHFRGSVDMQKKPAAAGAAVTPSPQAAKPDAKPTPVQAAS